MSDYDDDYSSQQYREETEDNRDYEEIYNGYYDNQEEEDMEVALDMYGRDSQAYRSASKAYRHRGWRTLSPYEYRRTFSNRVTVTVPLPSPIDQISVSEGKLILTWILEERFGTVSVLAQIIVSYVDDQRLEEVFKNLEKLRLT